MFRQNQTCPDILTLCMDTGSLLHSECINTGMEHWNGGILEWNFLKFNIIFYIQISTTPPFK